ncbi:hypothetical protein U1Q18_012761 [Sarracenia purpurea var. burkii]
MDHQHLFKVGPPRTIQAVNSEEESGKMQAAKNTAASVKETAANVAASARSGLDKTKATVQEKVDWLTANDPTEKEMARERKEEGINQAEYRKQEAREHNAASRQAAAADGTESYTTGGGILDHPISGDAGGGIPDYTASGLAFQDFPTAGGGGGFQNNPTSGNTTDYLTGSDFSEFGSGGQRGNRIDAVGLALDPRSTDTVYPADLDSGNRLNISRNTVAGGGGGGGDGLTSGYGSGGAYNQTRSP